MSFESNDGGLILRLADIYKEDFVVLYTPKAEKYAQQLAKSNVRIVPYTSRSLLFQNTISLLKNAKVLLVDNYFSELAILKGKQTIIQLWHAIGAIKQFGWQDLSNQRRSTMDKQRFQRVYDSMTDVVVSSEKMGEVFIKSYKIHPSAIRLLGNPKADVLLQKRECASPPTLMVYAPTYRKSQEQMNRVLEQALTVFAKFPEKKFLLKVHPTVVGSVSSLPPNTTLAEEPLEQLFCRGDVLITDYSASIFEFFLAKKKPKTVFFVPDKEVYEKNPGIQENFFETAPGRIAATASELYRAIAEMDLSVNEEKIQAFNGEWNTYNDGQACQRVMALVEERMEK